MIFLLLGVFLHALFAVAEARATEAADLLLFAGGNGTVCNPFPFSKAKVNTAAHWLQSQKCSMRCGIEPSQRLREEFES
jgi:hypothetical protein